MSHLRNSLPESELNALMSDGRSWHVDRDIADMEGALSAARKY